MQCIIMWKGGRKHGYPRKHSGIFLKGLESQGSGSKLSQFLFVRYCWEASRCMPRKLFSLRQRSSDAFTLGEMFILLQSEETSRKEKFEYKFYHHWMVALPTFMTKTKERKLLIFFYALGRQHFLSPVYIREDLAHLEQWLSSVKSL